MTKKESWLKYLAILAMPKLNQILIYLVQAGQLMEQIEG
jgi:hypothetical protein